MARFKPGQSGNPAGRPKRKHPEECIAEIRRKAALFLLGKYDDLPKLYEKLSTNQKTTLLTTLHKLIVPPPQEELMRLSEEDLNRILKALEERQKAAFYQ